MEPPTSFNRCNLPPWVIASAEFNDDPRPIEVQGVRASNAWLFRALDGIDDPAERARRLDDWITVRFQLHQWQAQATSSARRSLRNGYLRFLRGWGHDSSSVEGAVLKAWVQSRMGIPPTWHHGRLDDPAGEPARRFAVDRTAGSARTSAIFDQLDLVYAFTQYELARTRPAARWVTLWRGQHEVGPGEVIAAGPGREQLVRLNNLCSFTDDPERAWEFGSTVWEARVAAPRIFCASWLLHGVMRAEREALVIGGEMRVRRVMG
ncbi:NAD(+)--dinitrogen-reductase ADP-D-ribosyltransferase [Anaeromyxobacter sp. PSR-1]|uniref:NAD(+)--dinitrogen-reductase ADP-D-ribosyltransferase n=1 Tax=Anaeromyxobacter sp. PSR-1 TaxID=1300915 RepID=UPI0005E54902|nr:NAD(+)--dinitrogen-reductase ADP-D-ribosyltransferase [Anaeromyxobacter sp. PSR-1]GAO02064.1 NAD(+)--dinitrogen-reductase ADP-D-ribosyltransferase [Anaeromyxobacter sp. PSR-1]